jgi:hypothetical protein
MTKLKRQFVEELKKYCETWGIPALRESEGVWEVGNGPKIVIYVLTYGGKVRPGWQLRKVSALRESRRDWVVVLLKTGLGFMLHGQQAIQILQGSRDGKVDENKIEGEAFAFSSSTDLFDLLFK